MTAHRQSARAAAGGTPRTSSASRQRRRPPVVAQFADLFESATDIIIVNDREGRILAANRMAREFGGYSLEDIERGVMLREVLPSPDFEAAMVLTERALDGLPVPEVYEREAVLRDGSRRRLELRSNVLHRRGRPYALQTIGRDITEKTEAAAFQASLLQVSQALLTAPSISDLAHVICNEAQRILHVDGAYLWLRRADELIGSAAAGFGADRFVGIRRSIVDSVIGEFYRATDVLVVNDVQHSLYSRFELSDFSLGSLMAVPLRRSGPGVGVLVFVDSTNQARFTGVLRDRALILGAQTTVAIESALAREGEEEEGRVSAALLRVARTIRETLDEPALLKQIAGVARDVIACDSTLVALWDTTASALRAAATDGWANDAADELRLVDIRPAGSDVLRPLLSHHTVEVPEPDASSRELLERWNIASYLAAPMVRANHLIGIIVAGFRQRRGPFAARERRILEGIAAQAAIAVDNARLVEDLRRANSLKTEFLSTMSHELRTPLSAIIGYAELIRDGAIIAASEDYVQALDRMLINGRGLLELINMTLDINRLESGRVTIQSSEFTLDELLGELRSEFGVRVAAGEVELAWPDVAALPPLLQDRPKVKVILRNLVDNALKFTPAGRVTVTAQYNADFERLRLAVQDTGIGIAEENLPVVFDMFRQLQGARAASRAGVGLGLYLVRRYAELLGGGVHVESAVGRGSTFRVDIPLRLEVPG